MFPGRAVRPTRSRPSPPFRVDARGRNCFRRRSKRPAARDWYAPGGPEFEAVPCVHQTPKTWNSETCPAGQPLLAVKVSRTWRVVTVEGSVRVAVLPVAGSKV